MREFDNDERFLSELAAAHDRLIENDTGHDRSVSRQAPPRALPNELAEELASASDVLHLLERVRLAGDGDTARAHVAETLDLNPPTVESTGTLFAATGELAIPAEIGRFAIQRELGQGGYGIVFLARDEELNRLVALKVPRPEAILTVEMQTRFLREGKAAALLSHPNIVPVFETGRVGRVCFIVSRFVDGCSLADLLDGGRQCEPTEAAALVAVLADATQHAHSKGVIHRDLKPANILVEREEPGETIALEPGRVRITDFGMAKVAVEDAQLTGQGTIIGTPSYMAPEQSRGTREPVTEAADIYALGAILYELLAGRPPFVGETVLETLSKVQHQEPAAIRRPAGKVSPDLEAIYCKCLEKAPAARYESAAALAADLDRFLNGEPVVARPVTQLRRVGKWCTRNPVIALISAALMLALTTGLISVTALWTNASYQRSLAESRERQVQLKANQLTTALHQLFTSIADSPEIQLSGAEPLRRRLLLDANSFYEQLVSEQPHESALITDQASTLNQLSRIRAYLGDFRGALDAGRDALELVNSAQDETHDLRTAAIASHLAIAHALGQLAETHQLRQHTDQAVSLARYAVGDSLPGNRERVTLARTLTEVAKLTAEHGTQTESNQLNDDALSIWESLGFEHLNQDDQRTATASYLSAAKGLATSGNGQRARELLDVLIPRLEVMVEVKEPPPALQRRLAEAHRIMGFTLDRQHAEAQRHFEAGTDIQERLVREHPLVPLFQCDQLTMRYSQMLSHYINGHYEHALPGLQTNVAEARRLADDFPDEEMTALRVQANSLALLGYAYDELARDEEQLSVLTESRALNERICELADHSPKSRLELAGAIAGIGRCLPKFDRHEEAVALLDESNEMLRELATLDPENKTVQRYWKGNAYEKSKALFDLERYEEALACFDDAMPLHIFPAQLMHGARAKWLLPLKRYQEATEEVEAFGDFVPESLSNQVNAVRVALALMNALLDFAPPQDDAERSHYDALFEISVQEILTRLDTLADAVTTPNESTIVTELFDAIENSTVIKIPEISEWLERNGHSINED